jgi:2,3-bisphosphoglycerate-dependent phosphoglycerate mutase
MKKLFITVFFLAISVHAIGQTTTVFFIRHAEKVDQSKNPELSKIGQERAQHWKTLFAQVPLKAIYSTNYLRTIQTATPIATSKNLPILTYDLKDITLEKLKKEHNGQTLLIVGHSNTTPDLVNKLIDKNAYLPIEDTVFGNLYILTINGNDVSHQLLQGL